MPPDERTPAEAPAASPEEARKRVLFAAAAAIVLLAIVLAIVLAGGTDGGESAAAAPAECLERWNDDPDALAYARHNAIFHNYSQAEVGYMPETGAETVSSDPSEGSCVVVFARTNLDPEPIAAGQIPH